MACCGTGFSAGKFIAAIVAVGVGGFVAFNYATNGSLCSSCDKSKDATPAAQAVSAETPSADACPMGGCSMGATEVAAHGACSGEKTACSDDMATACEGDKVCPMTGETVHEVAATEAKTGACGKECGGEGCDPSACGDCGGCDKEACDKPAEEVATSETEKTAG